MAQPPNSPQDPATTGQHATVYRDASAMEAELKSDLAEHRKLWRFLCWRLTKKQWIWSLVGAILLFAAVFVLVFFLAIVPGIFQKYVNDVGMQINYMDITSVPTDPAATEIDMELSVRITYDSSVSSSIDEARAELYYEGKPFGAIMLPAQSFEKNQGDFDLLIQDKAQLTDVDVFTALSKALVTDKSLSIATSVQVTARGMGLSASELDFNRDFTVKAFDSFAEPAPTVNTIQLNNCTASAIKMRINVTLDNASQVGINSLGALNMSVYHEENYLGQAIATSDTVGIPRGPTPMELELTIERDASAAQKLMTLAGDLLGSGVQFYITGDHPYATDAVLLQPALELLKIAILYKDGLTKVQFGGTCTLSSLLG